MKTPFAFLFLIAWMLGGNTAAHAFTWTPGWQLPATTARAVPEAERAQAHALAEAVDSAATVRTAIQAWEAIAAAQPHDPAAWIELASLRLLEGAAFRSRARERRACYVAALQAAEHAMATHPEFLRRVQAGETPWQAASTLGPREIGALHFWSTGVFYIFRDCLGLFGRIVNARQMEAAKTMLQHMDAIDATWEDHTSTFSWGIYYLAMPASRGGDRLRSRDCFDRAVALGGQRTLPRWGRGKYFYPALGESAAAHADLAAVAARDLDDLHGSRAWNRYFKAEATRLLAP